MFYTYILTSEKEGKHYIGSTSNLEDRIKRHNEGRERYTKKYAPYKLIFKRGFKTRSEAYQFERKIKSFKSSKFLERFLRGLRDRSSIG